MDSERETDINGLDSFSNKNSVLLYQKKNISTAVICFVFRSFKENFWCKEEACRVSSSFHRFCVLNLNSLLIPAAQLQVSLL